MNYATDNISVELKEDVIFWTPQKEVPQKEWEASFYAGVDMMMKKGVRKWLCDTTNLTSYQPGHISFIADKINPVVPVNGWKIAVAHVMPRSCQGEIAVQSYRLLTDFTEKHRLLKSQNFEPAFLLPDKLPLTKEQALEWLNSEETNNFLEPKIKPQKSLNKTVKVSKTSKLTSLLHLLHL